MGLLDDITLGRYVPGDSPSHRLDARLKLVGIPVLIIAVFAVRDPVQLAGLLVAALALVVMSGLEWSLWWRGVRMLRWLFLFTLLLHLFLSPGRTLFGVAWLSLDGLLRGLLVCSQLALAIVFSSFLTLTTAPRELAGALGDLLAPLERFGLPVGRLTTLLLLVLHFIPVVRQEAAALLAESGRNAGNSIHSSLVERGRAVRRLAAPLLLRLVERADALSREMASGAPLFGDCVSLPPFRRCGLLSHAVMAAGLLWLAVLFLVKP